MRRPLLSTLTFSMPASWWTVLRSVFLGTYIIFNALVCSLSVWHLSLSQSAGHLFALDVYIIVISTLVLLGVFLIVFLENTLTHPRFSKLWLEFTWVNAILITEFAGAVALSILGSDIMCPSSPVTLIIDQSCAANSTLLAFFWMSTAVAFLNVLTLLSFLVRARRRNVTIWQCVTSNIQWSHPASCLPSVPASPEYGRTPFQRSMIAAPQPRRARRPLSGLPSDYEVEHYVPPEERTVPIIAIPEPKIIRAPATFYGTHLQQQVAPAEPELTTQQAPLVIPPPPPPPLRQQQSEFTSLSIPEPEQPQRPAQQEQQLMTEPEPPRNTVTNINITASRLPMGYIRPLPPSPPKPLGDWPRADAMVRESTKKRGKRRAIDPEDQPSSSAPRPQLEATSPSIPDPIPASSFYPSALRTVHPSQPPPAALAPQTRSSLSAAPPPTSFTAGTIRTRRDSEPLLAVPSTERSALLQARRVSADQPPPVSRSRPAGPRLSSEKRVSADILPAPHNSANANGL